MNAATDINAPGWIDSEGRLLIGRNPVTGVAFFPPRPLCPGALNESRTEAASGRGQIYSFSIVSRASPEVAVLAFVKLDEGPMMMSNIVDCEPADLAIGQSVELVVRERDGRAVPVFTPVS